MSNRKRVYGIGVSSICGSPSRVTFLRRSGNLADHSLKLHRRRYTATKYGQFAASFAMRDIVKSGGDVSVKIYDDGLTTIAYFSTEPNKEKK